MKAIGVCLKCNEHIPEENGAVVVARGLLHKSCYDEAQREVGASRWKNGITRKQVRAARREKIKEARRMVHA